MAYIISNQTSIQRTIMTAPAPKIARATSRNRRFTVSEVGAMLDMRPVEVNNLIAEIAHLGVVQTTMGRRTIATSGLLPLLIARELVHCQLRPEIRSRALLQAAKAKGERIAVPGTNLEILLEPHCVHVARRLRALAEAEASVVARPGIMQGEPCIRGTRVPVYVVGAIAAAHGVEEALATYPSLQARQIELASLFARAYPRKGRPKRIAAPRRPRMVSQTVIGRTKPMFGG
jgi:uncharacterized protein (DUF433 family)